MNRQQAVIAIAKINKTLRILAYWQELVPGEYVKTVEQELAHFGEWSEGIRDFLLTCEDKKIFDYASLIVEPTVLHHYVSHCSGLIPSRVLRSINVYLKTVPEFKMLRDAHRKGVRGNRHMLLPEEIDSDDTLLYMERAVKAGLLDENFQPAESTAPFQLRLIAYSVGRLVGIPLRKRWVYFDNLWSHIYGGRATKVPVPRKTRQGDVKAVCDIYPEVDFTDVLAGSDKSACFTAAKSQETILWLYESLKKEKYISSKVTVKSFSLIFASNVRKKAVEWTGDQKLLALFVYEAFHRSGHNDRIWYITEKCFTVNGRKPNRHSMNSAMTKILREGNPENIDGKLVDIARTFRNKV